MCLLSVACVWWKKGGVFLPRKTESDVKLLLKVLPRKKETAIRPTMMTSSSTTEKTRGDMRPTPRELRGEELCLDLACLWL
jgi:hypothetical protein